MNNLDWLCENDREQLMKLLAEGDSCEYCALEIEDDCGVRCNEGVRAWLEAEHEEAEVIQNGEKYKLADADTREKLMDDIRASVNADDAEEYTQFMGDVESWLDRQAAITRRETLLENPLHNNPYVGLVRGKQWERKESSDYYCGKCGWKVTDHYSYCPECGGALHREPNQPTSQSDAPKTAENAENDASKYAIYDFDDSREKLEEVLLIDELNDMLDCQKETTKRECEWWKSRTAELYERIMELEAELCECDEQRIEYRDQRDWYRDRLGEFRKKLGDAVWHAQAIVRMAEVDA